VIDLGGEIGAYCARLLAGFGARVLHVEPPAGDALRRHGPWVHGRPGVERALRHLHYNAGKESVTLDLDRPAGIDLLARLIDRADVLIDGRPPGDLAARGLDYDALRERNPRLIVAAITPYGLESPYRDAPATDLTGLAMGGMVAINGFPEDPPLAMPARQGYHMASLAAASAITMAVVARDLNPPARGPLLDISMQQAAALATFQTASTGFYRLHGVVPRRGGYASVGGRGRSLYQCGDGDWVIFWIPPAFWDHFFTWLDDEGLLGDLAPDCWTDPALRAMDHPRIVAATTALVGRWTRDAIVVEGQRRRVLTVPVNDVADIARDPHLRERGFFVEMEHPALGGETLPAMGAPFVLSGTPLRLVGPAPALGADTERVLRADLNLDAAAVAALREQGVV
jgi:benzylsuccinate CoA-transferase BbsE subunit